MGCILVAGVFAAVGEHNVHRCMCPGWDASEFGIGSAHNVGCCATIHEGTGWVSANRDAEIQGLGAIRARRCLANQRELQGYACLFGDNCWVLLRGRC
jgi:hypothetical protein